MTNISAMQAIAQLNKLIDQRAEAKPQQSENNKSNSIFGQKKSEVTPQNEPNLDRQIEIARKQVEAAQKAENAPIDGTGSPFSE